MQLNMQSYRTKFTDLKIIGNKYPPACICLQETIIKDRKMMPSQYTYASKVVRNEGFERRAAILAHNRLHHKEINLNTTLQTVVITIYLNKRFI